MTSQMTSLMIKLPQHSRYRLWEQKLAVPQVNWLLGNIIAVQFIESTLSHSELGLISNPASQPCVREDDFDLTFSDDEQYMQSIFYCIFLIFLYLILSFHVYALLTPGMYIF